jgi:hypothetical protein
MNHSPDRLTVPGLRIEAAGLVYEVLATHRPLQIIRRQQNLA